MFLVASAECFMLDFLYFAGQYLELSVPTVDPRSSGSHRDSDPTGPPDGRVSAGSATVPDAYRFV